MSPEEVEALLDDESSPVTRSVTPRDFRKPHRLSRSQQLSIRSAVTHRLLDIERRLFGWLRGSYPLDLLDVGETTTVGLFEHLEDPIVVLTVEVGGVPGWVVWENDAALVAAAVAMGSDPPEEGAEPEERHLTPLEAGVVGDLLQSVAAPIGEALGIAVEAGTMSLDVRTFLAQLAPPGMSDPQRLFLHLCLDGPGGQSTIRFYLPGLLPEQNDSTTSRGATLPGHLDEVPVEISARLGSIDVTLQDLMGVEVGDVIPLGLSVGDPLEIMVEGHPAGTASWGSYRGRLAVRLDKLTTEREKKPS